MESDQSESTEENFDTVLVFRFSQWRIWQNFANSADDSLIVMQANKSAWSEKELEALHCLSVHENTEQRQQIFRVLVFQKNRPTLDDFLHFMRSLLLISSGVLTSFQRVSRPKNICRIFALQVSTRNADILGMLRLDGS